MLDYKNRAYSDSAADKAEQVKLEKQLGVRERTASDWKRVFSYKTKDGKIEIVKYLGTDADVFDPEKIGKNTVARIGYHAFEWNEALVSVQLPKTVVEIGPIAFMRCTNLVKINLPSSLEVIGYEAFASCPSLTIHASAGSYAEQYANEHHIPFEAE